LPEIGNSEVVKHVLQTLFNISSRKTTQGRAATTLSELINKLKVKYDFLKHVEINDTRYIEMGEPISVMSGIDKVNSNDIGKALHDIIKDMNFSLREDLGFFFIKELKNNLGDDYNSTMEEMGVDLGLMQLEFEVSEMSRKL
jgi:hypothetical protein